MKNSFFLSLILLCSSLFLQAQKTMDYEHYLRSFQDANELFKQKNFVRAKQLFTQLKGTTPHPLPVDNSNMTLQSAAQFYEAVCAYELFQPDAEKLLLDYYNHHYKTSYHQIVPFYLGSYYFREKKYKDALEYLKKVNVLELDNELLTEYKFQLGYGYFREQEFDKAYTQFNAIKNIKGKYYYPTNYYLGYIQFEKKQYDAALRSFEPLKESKVYQKIIPYYLAQIHFFEKDYETLIDYIEEIEGDRNVKYQEELGQLAGQAYYEQKDYAKALPYLEDYAKQSRSLRESDVYQLGFAHYKNKDWPAAIKYLERLDSREDSLGQNALYILADCYMQEGNKTNARSAYQKAAEIGIDPKINEYSHFNYARLSYEQGFLNEALESLQNFIRDYPNSDLTVEAKEILTEILLNSRNYAQALQIIESISNPSNKVRAAYQKVAYFRAIELYNTGDYEKAILLFNTSHKNPIDEQIKAEAYFWKAEALYALDRYADAIKEYDNFNWLASSNKLENSASLVAQSSYSAGYAYIKLDDYPAARPYFAKSIENLEKSRNSDLVNKIYSDAILRFGDCYFIMRNYPKAAEQYNIIVDRKLKGADYALYQKAIIAGLNGEYDKKITLINQIQNSYAQSLYLDDALFEKGKTLINTGRANEAVTVFKNITQNMPNSKYAPEAYLKLGLIYYNTDKIREALESYKSVLDKYPKSSYAKEALRGVKDISVSEGNPDIYLSMVKNRAGFNVSEAAQDSLLYEAAEAQFVSGKTDKAIAGFEKYLESYPNGFNSTSAHFYLGESLYKKNEFDKALENYKVVIESGENKFLEKALAKASKISFERVKDFNLSYDYFKKLLEIASFKENTKSAHVGLLRSAYKTDNFRDVKTEAMYILNNKAQFNQGDVEEAKYYLAKILYKENEISKAKNHFEELSKINSEYGAESIFRLGEIAFNNKDYEASMNECFRLIEEMPSYEKWRVKAFILLAENYAAQKNYFQAKATLESIINNYSGEELKQEAQLKLENIKKQEAAESDRIQIKSDTSNVFNSDTSEQIEFIEPENQNDEVDDF
ncbi:MAG: tetratricopeptide repeat protein [Chitinophagales bacterium]